MQPITQPTKSRKWRWVLVGGGIVLLLVIGLIFWATTGNKATITPAAAPQQTTQSEADKTYDGQYLTFRYRGIYLAGPMKSRSDELELTRLTADTNYDKHIDVSVEPLKDGNLTTNGAYNLRQTFTQTYTKREVAIAQGTAIIWVKQDGSEQTAFMVRGNKVAQLAFNVTGTNDPGDLTTEVNAALATFHWK